VIAQPAYPSEKITAVDIAKHWDLSNTILFGKFCHAAHPDSKLRDVIMNTANARGFVAGTDVVGSFDTVVVVEMVRGLLGVDCLNGECDCQGCVQPENRPGPNGSRAGPIDGIQSIRNFSGPDHVQLEFTRADFDLAQLAVDTTAPWGYPESPMEANSWGIYNNGETTLLPPNGN